MALRPFMKWYPSDWRADPQLRMCSLGGRGLWIDLIGYMHEGEPYGHLTIAGVSPAIEDIAALVGRPLPEVRKAVNELEAKHVFSRTDDGVIYSRRMVRDKAKADTDRENGKGGGNPKLRGEDNAGVNPPDKAHIPEARDQRPEEENPPDGGPAKYAFESGVIRLSKLDFDLWRASFSHLDLAAELLGLTEWAATQRNWFHAVKGALTKRNREVGIAKSKAKDEPAFKWNGGIEGVI